MLTYCPHRRDTIEVPYRLSSANASGNRLRGILPGVLRHDFGQEGVSNICYNSGEKIQLALLRCNCRCNLPKLIPNTKDGCNHVDDKGIHGFRNGFLSRFRSRKFTSSQPIRWGGAQRKHQ